MSDDNIKSLVDYSNNAAHASLEYVCNLVLKDVSTGGENENCKKMLVLVLDDNDDAYNITYYQAGMKMSEMVSLCELAKSLIKEKIGF